ncbi:MAG: hypothetical protein ACO35C_04360 [Pontimonas sp.]
MRLWLRSLQVDDEPECRDLKAKMTEFVRDGHTASGSFTIEKIQKKVAYMLSTRVDSKIGIVR